MDKKVSYFIFSGLFLSYYSFNVNKEILLKLMRGRCHDLNLDELNELYCKYIKYKNPSRGKTIWILKIDDNVECLVVSDNKYNNFLIKGNYKIEIPLRLNEYLSLRGNIKNLNKLVLDVLYSRGFLLRACIGNNKDLNEDLFLPLEDFYKKPPNNYILSETKIEEESEYYKVLKIKFKI